MKFSLKTLVLVSVLGSLAAASLGWSGEIAAKTELNVPYKSGADLSEYEKERCKLDLYIPEGKEGFPTLVWLHGGGITSGSKDDLAAVAERFNRAGIAFVAINYRLSPKVNYPAYVDDTAAAFAWMRANIARYGGDPRRVFLGGHSAGAYLSSLVGMDERYLKKYGLGTVDIAGLVPISGQMMTHFTVREERGVSENTIVADEAAPIYFIRKDTPPFLILMGDSDWPARWEENVYFVASMKAVGNKGVTIRQIPNRNHGTIASEMMKAGDPVAAAMMQFIKDVSAMR